MKKSLFFYGFVLLALGAGAFSYFFYQKTENQTRKPGSHQKTKDIYEDVISGDVSSLSVDLVNTPDKDLKRVFKDVIEKSKAWFPSNTRLKISRLNFTSQAQGLNYQPFFKEKNRELSLAQLPALFWGLQATLALAGMGMVTWLCVVLDDLRQETMLYVENIAFHTHVKLSPKALNELAEEYEQNHLRITSALNETNVASRKFSSGGLWICNQAQKVKLGIFASTEHEALAMQRVREAIAFDIINQN